MSEIPYYFATITFYKWNLEMLLEIGRYVEKYNLDTLCYNGYGFDHMLRTIVALDSYLGNQEFQRCLFYAAHGIRLDCETSGSTWEQVEWEAVPDSKYHMWRHLKWRLDSFILNHIPGQKTDLWIIRTKRIARSRVNIGAFVSNLNPDSQLKQLYSLKKMRMISILFL